MSKILVGCIEMCANDCKHSYKFMVSGDSISKGVIFDEVKSRYVILESNYINLLKSKLTINAKVKVIDIGQIQSGLL